MVLDVPPGPLERSSLNDVVVGSSSQPIIAKSATIRQRTSKNRYGFMVASTHSTAMNLGLLQKLIIDHGLRVWLLNESLEGDI